MSCVSMYLMIAVPGRAAGAHPEPMHTDLRAYAPTVAMGPGFPRYTRAPGGPSSQEFRP
jgi:hypothetical protein